MTFFLDSVFPLDEALAFETMAFFFTALDLPTVFDLEDGLGFDETLTFRAPLDFETGATLALIFD